MKRKLLYIVALLLAVVVSTGQARASDDEQYILFVTPTGVVKVVLSENPVITIANDNLVITTEEKTVEVPVAEISGYTYHDPAITGIRIVEATQRQVGGAVSFEKLAPGTAVAIYSTSGEQLSSTNASNDGTAELDMQRLPKGIYIIKAGKTSIKVTNK